jgi:hypothetical protein
MNKIQFHVKGGRLQAFLEPGVSMKPFELASQSLVEALRHFEGTGLRIASMPAYVPLTSLDQDLSAFVGVRPTFNGYEFSARVRWGEYLLLEVKGGFACAVPKSRTAKLARRLLTVLDLAQEAADPEEPWDQLDSLAGALNLVDDALRPWTWSGCIAKNSVLRFPRGAWVWPSRDTAPKVTSLWGEPPDPRLEGGALDPERLECHELMGRDPSGRIVFTASTVVRFPPWAGFVVKGGRVCA